MGGIQAKAGSVAEVHAVQGGQLILRVSTSQTSKTYKKGAAKRQNSIRSLLAATSGAVRESGSQEETDSQLYRSVSLRMNQYRCCILDQSMDVLEKILMWLSPRDLALLSLTSKQMHRIVMNFVEHYNSSYGLRKKVDAFYAENQSLLLPKESILRDRLQNNPKPQLLLYSAMKQFLGTVRRVGLAEQLILQQQQQNGPDMLSPDGVMVERDVALKRDVLIFTPSRPHWHFTYVFKDVPPGRYFIQTRMKLTMNVLTNSNLNQVKSELLRRQTGSITVSRICSTCQVHYYFNPQQNTTSKSANTLAVPLVSHHLPEHKTNPEDVPEHKHKTQTIAPYSDCEFQMHNNNNDSSDLSCNSTLDIQSGPVKSEDSQQQAFRPPSSPLLKPTPYTKKELVTQVIDGFWWSKIHGDHYFCDLSHGKVIYDRDSDWFFLKLNAFDVSSTTDLEFQFVDSLDLRDPDQILFRHSLIWDFIELRQVINMKPIC